jgi:hypothetical protein
VRVPVRGKEDLQMKKMKLYVLGESSGDPDNWGPYTQRALVLARSKEEALAMGDFTSVATEVWVNKPGLLCLDQAGGEP